MLDLTKREAALTVTEEQRWRGRAAAAMVDCSLPTLLAVLSALSQGGDHVGEDADALLREIRQRFEQLP